MKETTGEEVGEAEAEPRTPALTSEELEADRQRIADALRTFLEASQDEQPA